MPIKIDILSNTRDAVRGVEDFGDALEKVSGSVDDVARDAQRSGDKVSDAYTDAAKDGEQAAQRLERSFQEASDATAAAGKRGGDDLGSNIKRGAAEAEDGVRDFKQEAKQNAEEVASSFDGSAQSIGDGFQSVAATAFAGFGPAGMVAGLAAAAGLGLIFAQVEKNDEKTQELREEVGRLTDEYIATGRVGESSMSSIAEKIKELATQTEEGKDSLSTLNEAAEKAGVPFDQLAKAMAGDTAALDDLIQKTTEHIDAIDEQQTSQYQGNAGFASATTAAERQRDALIGVRDKLIEQKDATNDATEASKLYGETGAAVMEQAAARQEEANQRISDSNDAVAENMGGYVEAVQSAYAEAGAAVDSYVEDGVFNLQKYTEESQKQADAITNYQANMAALSEELSAEALAYIANLGPQAAPLLDAYVKAPLDQKAATAAVWTQLGKTSTDAYGSEVQYRLDQSNFRAAARLTVDDSALQAYLRKTSLSMGVTLRVADGTYGNGLGTLKRVP